MVLVELIEDGKPKIALSVDTKCTLADFRASHQADIGEAAFLTRSGVPVSKGAEKDVTVEDIWDATAKCVNIGKAQKLEGGLVEVKPIKPKNTDAPAPPSLIAVRPDAKLPQPEAPGKISKPTLSSEQWEGMLNKASMLNAISFGSNPRRAYLPLFKIEGPLDISASAVTESKFVSSVHYSQAESTLAVLGFANAAVAKLTFGAAGGAQYSYGNHQYREEVWITCQYLMPKFSLLLSPERNPWMKVNQKYLDEAKALANKGKAATQKEIGEFLAAWGEYFPTELVIGAELYSETHKQCNAQATEHGFKIEAEAAFKKDLSKIGIGLGVAGDIGNKNTDGSESLVINCKGGVNEQLGRPGAWLESLADPTAWVPIKLDNLVSVLDLLPENDAKILEAQINDYKQKELAKPQQPKIILNRSPIKLKLSETSLYLATPQVRKGWPHANVDALPCPHTIQLVDAIASSTKPILNGATVRLIAAVTTHEGYTHLYSSNEGNGYYDLFSDNTKQKWQVKIVGKAENEPLCEGDKVQFVNMQWPDCKLYMYDGPIPHSVGIHKSEPNNVWQVCL